MMSRVPRRRGRQVGGQPVPRPRARPGLAQCGPECPLPSAGAEERGEVALRQPLLHRLGAGFAFDTAHSPSTQVMRACTVEGSASSPRCQGDRGSCPARTAASLVLWADDHSVSLYGDNQLDGFDGIDEFFNGKARDTFVNLKRNGKH